MLLEITQVKGQHGNEKDILTKLKRKKQSLGAGRQSLPLSLPKCKRPCEAGVRNNSRKIVGKKAGRIIYI